MDFDGDEEIGRGGRVEVGRKEEKEWWIPQQTKAAKGDVSGFGPDD